MANYLTDRVRAEIKDYVSSLGSETELVGFVFADGDCNVVENLATFPQSSFEMRKSTYEQAMGEGAIALWHTHINSSQGSRLSPHDLEGSRLTRLPYLVYHTVFEEWDYFDPDGIDPYPLLRRVGSPRELSYYDGWPFEWNRSDCYTLFRSFYQGYLGIPMLDYLRPAEEEDIESPNWNSFLDNFEKEGFREVEPGESLKPYDVAFMAVRGTNPHHCGILIDLDRQTMLHCATGRGSEFTVYSGGYQRRTRKIIRHKEL
jgi:hypothetical protein